jgi:hypothetical protein
MHIARRVSHVWSVVMAIAITVVGLAMTPQVVRADTYDDACGAPTITISTSAGAAITVGPTDVVLIAGGTFTGGINEWQTGGVICLAGPATFAPPYMNNANGALFSRGAVTMPSTAVGGSFNFERGHDRRSAHVARRRARRA